MKIAVLSGKGGAGKTLVAVNLAATLGNATYIDCDVEEPNGHLFFKPQNVTTEPVNVMYPSFDQAKCIGCRECVKFCRFNALAYVKGKVIVFDEVCHSCYGCQMVCKQRAISMQPKQIGEIQKGTHKDIDVYSGIINIGEASGVPIIKQLLCEMSKQNTIIDCPPGSACIVMESIKDADYCILVAEPTIFGVHNLEMVWELVNVFNKKFGVVLNKCIDGESIAEKFCIDHNIDIIGRINFDSTLGKLSSNGEIITEIDNDYKKLFQGILDKVGAK